MSLFRKTALDALSTPEQLNQPLQLLRTTQWMLLISLSSFSMILLAWAILGRLPVRLTGRGLLIKTDAITVVQSETIGQVNTLLVDVGDCVDKGALMGQIEAVKQEVEIKANQDQLNQLSAKDRNQDLLSNIRIDQLQEEINRVKHLAKSGAISLDDLNRRKADLNALIYSIEGENSSRELQINSYQNSILSLKEQLKRTSLVRAPIDGCVLDRGIHNGEVVNIGTTLFTLRSNDEVGELESIVFFPAKDGKRLQVGQQVRISPTTTKQQRHGGITGEIVSIRPLPIRDEAVIKRLGIKSLLEAVRNNPLEPLIEITTSLKLDPSTPSGYDWGGGMGPMLKLSGGTPTQVRVLVEERAPISYIIPILRDLTGIY